MRAAPSGPAIVSGVQKVLRDGASTAMRGGLDQLVRRNLRGVWARGAVPAGGCVWASNHHSWWDFFVAVAALRSAGRTRIGVLMDAENIGRRELFRTVGVVGTNQLRTATAMLADGVALVVFPEGELRPAGRLGAVRPGARWLAKQAGAQLIPVAIRVLLRGQQAPEAYLDLGPALPEDADLEQALGSRLSGLDSELAAANPELPLPGFLPLVVGVRSWNERFGALRNSE